MYYLVSAGCSVEEVYEAVEARSYEVAYEYASEVASQSFINHSVYYEGEAESVLNGYEDYDDDYDDEDYEAEYENLLFNLECENEFYEVVEFDFDNPFHKEILNAQDGEFIQI